MHDNARTDQKWSVPFTRSSVASRILLLAEYSHLAVEADAPVSRTADTTLLALALLAAGTLADLATTAVGLQLGLVEHNPIAHAALATHGFAALLGVKTAAIGVVAAGALAVRHYAGAYWVSIPGSVGGIWLAAALWNVLLLQGAIA